MIRENALLVFEKSINPSAQRHLPPTRLLQRVYAPTRPQQRVYATTRLRHNASTPTRPHQHVYANASEPQRVSANASAANASAAPTRLPQRVPTHASEPHRACSNASSGALATTRRPTRRLPSFCANASALARENVKFLSKTWIPLETSSKKSKKRQAKSMLLQKMITPIAVAEFPR